MHFLRVSGPEAGKPCLHRKSFCCSNGIDSCCHLVIVVLPFSVKPVTVENDSDRDPPAGGVHCRFQVYVGSTLRPVADVGLLDVNRLICPFDECRNEVCGIRGKDRGHGGTVEGLCAECRCVWISCTLLRQGAGAGKRDNVIPRHVSCEDVCKVVCHPRVGDKDAPSPVSCRPFLRESALLEVL